MGGGIQRRWKEDGAARAVHPKGYCKDGAARAVHPKGYCKIGDVSCPRLPNGD